MKLNNQSGFSLVELLVVVALLGILSTMAVPSYKSFKARALRQGGLKMLETYYVAAHATRAEFNVFPGDLVQTGFQPTGIQNYRLRAANGTEIPDIPNDDACFNSGNICTCGGACPDYRTWTEDPTGAVGISIGHVEVGGGPCSTLPAPYTTDDEFTVGVGSVVNTSATRMDRVFMNHLKQVEVCSDGTK